MVPWKVIGCEGVADLRLQRGRPEVALSVIRRAAIFTVAVGCTADVDPHGRWVARTQNGHRSRLNNLNNLHAESRDVRPPITDT